MSVKDEALAVIDKQIDDLNRAREIIERACSAVTETTVPKKRGRKPKKGLPPQDDAGL